MQFFIRDPRFSQNPISPSHQNFLSCTFSSGTLYLFLFLSFLLRLCRVGRTETRSRIGSAGRGHASGKGQAHEGCKTHAPLGVGRDPTQSGPRPASHVSRRADGSTTAVTRGGGTEGSGADQGQVRQFRDEEGDMKECSSVAEERREGSSPRFIVQRPAARQRKNGGGGRWIPA